MVCPRCGSPVASVTGACVQCGADLRPAPGPIRGTSSAASEEPTFIGRPEPPTAFLGDAGATILNPGDQPTVQIPARGGHLDGDAPTVLGSSAPGPVETGPLAVGQVFGGRYHIIRQLGIGGMGAVYQAWDKELAVAVAIKVIRPEIMADPAAVEDIRRRFKRELLLARQVTHKSVVRIHDLGEIDGIKYITMAYVNGDDLATILKKEGRLPVARALPIARAVVSGLAAAHAAGVVHRDLKPANIMVDADGEALIMDFGIARSTIEPVAQKAGDGRGMPPGIAMAAPAQADVTTMAAVIGTIEYMAPEQARGLPVDQRADIYAFGLILYDMLVGRKRSEHAGSAIAELQERMLQQPPSPRSLHPELPEALDRLISRCIEPDRDKRFRATTDLAAELATLDDNGEPIPVKRVFSVRFVAAILTLVIGLLGTTWYFARTRVGPTQHEPVSVLITDFDNRTNDPVFQGALEQTLSLAIEGASFINTYSREDAKNLARQVKPKSPFDVETARVISAREGIKYIIAGSIDARNGRYPITLKAIDPADGHVVATAEATASGKPAVLKTVGGLAVQIRQALGDTASRSDSLAAMDPVTTVSLEAIQAYSRGQDLALAGKLDEALKVFEEAVRLDPSLGRAYVQMAVIYNNQKRDRLAEENLQKGLKYLDRMTEREKYRTLGSYYLTVAHDYEKSAENYKELVRRYPADNSGHANLAFASLMLGDFELAVAEGRKAIEIYPRNLLQRTNYAMFAMYNSQFKLAVEQSNLVLKENPRFEYPILTLARATLGLGDVQGAHAAYARLRETSAFGASLAAMGEADIAMYQGKNREALRILEAGIAADVKSGDALDPRPKYVALAEAKLAMGDRSGAAEAALKAIEGTRQESVLVPAARVLIDVGRQEDAERIAADLENRLQRQTLAYAKLLDGEQSLRRNRLASALEALRDSAKRNESWFAHYALGRTYLQAGQFAQALQEFDWCFKHKGLAADAFIADSSTLRYFAPVQYWLGRAQQGLGSIDAAQRNYREFGALRQNADPPDPLAADAARRLSEPPSPR